MRNRPRRCGSYILRAGVRISAHSEESATAKAEHMAGVIPGYLKMLLHVLSLRRPCWPAGSMAAHRWSGARATSCGGHAVLVRGGVSLGWILG
jgi:hypothetical protein